MKFLAILLILFCGSNFVSAAERGAAITEAELVRRTQELYDAVVPGNQAPWKKYFVDDSIFADEKDAPWTSRSSLRISRRCHRDIPVRSRSNRCRVGFTITSQFLVTMLTRRRRSLARI